MKASPRLRASSALVALALAAPAVSARQAAPVQEVQRLEAWPEVPKEARAELEKDIERLRKASTEEMGAQARDALIARGACAAPLLLDKLGKEKDPAARERINAVLGAVTDAGHTRLLAQRFADGSEHMRVYALRRAATFPDPGIREPALAAWKKVSDAAAKGKAPELELYAAALAVTSSGALEALPQLLTEAESRWKTGAEEIRAAAGGARGPASTQLVADLLKDAAEPRIVAGLRVLSGCGDPETAPRLVRPYLDYESNQVRVAAINALRGIVDGEPPLDKLSAFDAIELAKKWKQRI